MVSLDNQPPQPLRGDGSFTMSDLTVGKHVLHAFAPGMTPLDKTLLVMARQTLDVGTLVLTPIAPLKQP